ncbi:polyprenyl synthetase family protein [Parvularcula sp. LCG005]|uniref:polyprenyl synthetase family protein n=1 Tax=Parvularcula sp. LCG005 TaxID=3078805 RepID=UPI0029434585|nr:polyprenyl synthetase family protein [Parvularcula sp. LCG005]WOI52102.1 polyprenyl synthetase family protein [Parvularcula sp. LCG005]
MAVAAEVQAPPRFSAVATELKDKLSGELTKVNDVILDNLSSSVPLIPQVAKHLIAAGGKRLRPLLTLAAADLAGSSAQAPKLLAAAVELIHAATLLHDDVVDDSALRRGLKTANVVFGNKESILVGDFLFARAFELMVKTDSLRALDILSRAACTISEGEVLQLETQSNVTTQRDTYIRVVSAKTAALFAAATHAGAVVANADATAEKALADYGLNFGIAYQLVDDALDYAGEAGSLGKTAGDDFREGKMTLPVILAIEMARNDDERAFWERTLGQGQQRDGDFERACQLIGRDDLITRSLEEAQAYAEKAATALSVLPPSPLRQTLEDLTISSVIRRS